MFGKFFKIFSNRYSLLLQFYSDSVPMHKKTAVEHILKNFAF